jgi:uncharacterized membrane protein YcaP (DUF421 family)
MLLAATPLVPFDWHRILWTPRTPPAYLGEIVFRCVVMYFIIIIALRVTGRRGVRQLSIFEISLVLALGSAAGDTMFYGTTSLLYAAVVFIVVTGLYWLFNLLTRRFPRLSDWLEGKPVLLIEDGHIKLENFRQLRLTQKELFGELRQQQVEHLGQVRLAYMEATGSLSVYFHPAAEPVRAGLPIRPEHCERRLRRADTAGPHACYCCGGVQQLAASAPTTCPSCQRDEWVPASTAERAG